HSGFYLDFIHPHDEWEVDIESDNDWFSLKFDIQLGESDETKLSLLPIISKLLSQYNPDKLPEEIPVEHHSGQFLILPKEKIQPIIDLMIELFDRIPMGDDVIKLSKFDALLLDQLDSDPTLKLQWSGDLYLKELGNKLGNFSGIKRVDPSRAFKGELRDYQHQGLSWLQFLREFEFSGILADDMGLGKTIQTLAHLQKEKSARRMKSPCLIIAPTSLMSNWKREAALFTPNLKVHISQGPDRHEHFDSLEKYDVILTTYPLIVRDFEVLFAINYHYIVLDEAQNIKNPKSQATKSIKTLKANHRLALTGTPMENHLGELWSIFDFLMAGFLGSQENFKTRYRNPIEKDHDPVVSKMLKKRVKPFLLRRSKQRVASELPPKTEIIKTVAFETSQSLLYETIRLSMEKKIQQAIATKGLNRSHITILDALLKLRQVCCDPQLVKLEQAKKVKHSAKMDLLMTMLPELVEEGRRVLIFSQFTSMLSIIEQALTAENITYSKLTGSTRKRDEAIKTFTSGKVNVFLISLKAGGVGLNLTEADTVIHYDPWWNPAVENQASDRAHRIGQDKPVFIYKLVVENTLEEKILEMQARKQALADGIYGDKSSEDTSKLTAEDLKELLGI
ncbi:MAG: DEAD/DEAH box helicase, partial [Gammaproteobacteria bacterium]|nr:DEAD/DEAH box helicase [Gammaproteobacteria bacterium]